MARAYALLVERVPEVEHRLSAPAGDDRARGQIPHGADLDHIVSEPRALEVEVVVSHNFAFGGIDTALIIRRVA